MKTSRGNRLHRLGGCIVVMALFAGLAGELKGQDLETTKGAGARRLLELNRKYPKPAPAESDYQPMSCPKCKDFTWTVKDNEPTKGAAARAQLAGGVPTKLVSSHLCKGCGTEWKSTGHGRTKVTVAIHKCTSCGSEDAACCNTKKGSTVATKGMEKDVKVAPLK